ncbi:MAG: GNAT family N-acetyltransferase [Myxococcota bacterium]
MRDPELRRAGVADRAEVSALWLALTEHHAAFDARYSLAAGARDEAGRLVEALLRDPDTAVYLAPGAGAAQALAIVRVAQAPPIHAERCRAEITDLFVAPEARRRGWGRRLVAETSAWARQRGAERMEVRVARSNPEGRAFWEACGYAAHMDVLDRRL